MGWVQKKTEESEKHIRNAKVKDEKRQLDGFRNKGEEGGKDWNRSIQGKKKGEVSTGCSCMT